MSQVSDIQFASDILIANYAAVAFVMILLYDYVLTFGEEVEFIWKQKISVGSILFLFNRYMPMIDLVIAMNSYTNRAIQQDKFCLPWVRIDVWITVLCVGIIDVLLLLRTWALWGRSRTILICLSVLLVACILAASGTSLYYSLTVVEFPSLNNIRSCLYTIPNINIIYGSYVSSILFDSTVMILTLIKAVPARQPNGLTPLITQLLKDGVQYFVIIFLTAIVNMIMVNLAPPAPSATLSILYLVMASTLGCRLILNLRGSILRPAYNEENTTIYLNTLVFNNHSNG